MIRMAYIESEMAKRHQQNTNNNATDNIGNPGSEATVRGPNSDLVLPQRQPASLGKLHEIDLGPDAKLRNIERTEAATRRLAGDQVPDEDEEDKDATSKKARPGVKDGKNWRARKRRNSEDIRRDKLVEEVLRESKRELFLFHSFILYILHIYISSHLSGNIITNIYPRTFCSRRLR